MKLYDQNGDECQMTGLPHMFYDKVPVDERIAELEKRIAQVCPHPFAKLGIDADGVMWCTECLTKPLRVPEPF